MGFQAEEVAVPDDAFGVFGGFGGGGGDALLACVARLSGAGMGCWA